MRVGVFHNPDLSSISLVIRLRHKQNANSLTDFVSHGRVTSPLEQNEGAGAREANPSLRRTVFTIKETRTFGGGPMVAKRLDPVKKTAKNGPGSASQALDADTLPPAACHRLYGLAQDGLVDTANGRILLPPPALAHALGRGAEVARHREAERARQAAMRASRRAPKSTPVSRAV